MGGNGHDGSGGQTHLAPGDDVDSDTKSDTESDAADNQEYDTMMILERLESLEEEMEDLGVRTLDEVRQRIEDLHAELDRRD